MTRHLLTTVNGKIVLLVFKITWAKIWCAYNAPSKYSKPWQWHKKLTSFPYGNQILMQTNWGKKYQPHSDFVYSRKQAKLFDTLACLYEVKKWSFLIHLFFLGGGGEEVNFAKVCLCFQQLHSFQKKKKHWKRSLCYLCYRKHCIYKHRPSYVQGWYFVPLVTTLMVGQLDHSLVHCKFHSALHWRQFVLTAENPKRKKTSFTSDVHI